MSTIQIDRLLDTVVRTGASDIHLTVGRKPTLRLHGGLKNLDTKVLDGDDCVSLMKQITPEKAQQELQEEGSCSIICLDINIVFKQGVSLGKSGDLFGSCFTSKNLDFSILN